jgi:hypothetical protein
LTGKDRNPPYGEVERTFSRRSSLSGNRRYWIFGVTADNWRISLERNLWGIAQRYRTLTKKIAKALNDAYEGRDPKRGSWLTYIR